MSSINGQYRTTQNRTNAMNVVMRALMSRRFENGRFEIEKADKDKYEMTARLKFQREAPRLSVQVRGTDTQAPTGYAQRVEVLVGIKFQAEERSSCLATWVISVISTRAEPALQEEINQTICEVLGEHSGQNTRPEETPSPTQAPSPTPTSNQKAAAAQPVQAAQSNYEYSTAPSKSNQAQAAPSTASATCRRCKIPRGQTYSFCLNCGHSFEM